MPYIWIVHTQQVDRHGTITWPMPICFYRRNLCVNSTKHVAAAKTLHFLLNKEPAVPVWCSSSFQAVLSSYNLNVAPSTESKSINEVQFNVGVSNWAQTWKSSYFVEQSSDGSSETFRLKKRRQFILCIFFLFTWKFRHNRKVTKGFQFSRYDFLINPCPSSDYISSDDMLSFRSLFFFALNQRI